MERLRQIQPAHKSDKITVAQAKKAWLKGERESARTARDPDRFPFTRSRKKGDATPPGGMQEDAES